MPNDLDLLQGEWTITALEMEGQSTPATMLATARIVIRGKRFRSAGMGAVYEGVLELDSSTRPRQLDMKFDSGPEKGNTNRGIYQLEGDRLRICLATRGDARPSTFASPPGSGFALETLTRGAAGAAAKTMAQPEEKPASAASGNVSELEGEWQMVSGIIDGKPMDKSLVQWVKRVTRGNTTMVSAGPNVMMQAEFTSNSAQSPKTIDYRNTAGSHKGKTQLGIYEFAGDLLKICMAAPGAERPRRFDAAPKDGTLTVWKRA
ncbi:MAG TPA: TIGR03067 domain-containing protein [Candidatus Angelobacter sp.]